MGHAFATQRELGRLCDEAIYQNDLAARLRAAGLAVSNEVQVTVCHRDFQKQYFLDLAIENALINELKTAATIVGDHERQLLTYLLLLNVPYGKLINFRPRSVEYKTVNAVPTFAEQRRFDLLTARWSGNTESDHFFVAILSELFKDWGIFLETSIYCEGLVHFLGGESTVYHSVPIARAGILLDAIRLPLLDDQTAFRITAVTEEGAGIESHLRRFLQLTPLKRLHWINLNHHNIEFATLTK
jgi:iron complex transport system substrate-binding protein